MEGNHTYIIQMSDQPHNDTSCANYQLISFIPHLMSEVNTLFTDCLEEADPDGHVTVDISQAVFTPGADEVSNRPEHFIIIKSVDERNDPESKGHSQGLPIQI